MKRKRSGSSHGMSRRTFLVGIAAAALSPVLSSCRGRGRSLPTLTFTPTPTSPIRAVPSPTQGPSPTPALGEKKAHATPRATRAMAEPSPTPTATPRPRRARVALVKTANRAEGVRRALALVGLPAVAGKRVFLKPNFNSAHPAPGSTHNEVLQALVEALWGGGATAITVGDRSGMGDTRQVMRAKGVFDLAAALNFDVLVLDELGPEGWAHIQPPDSHWSRGFLFAKPALEADVVVQACCLKTHRFGGHFTMSLKNSVGLVAKYGPDGYNYMHELHTSPYQRQMIAEINVAYEPALVVVDGVEAFVSGGPEQGKRVAAEVILAGSDRVALDAVGVAILRLLGTTPEVSRGAVFEQEQIARAVALGLGVERGEDIEFLTDDAASAAFADRVREILLGGRG